MQRALLDILRDPVTGSPLSLEILQESPAGRIESGLLRNAAGQTYAITNGIPRFVLTEDPDQQQTQGSFGYKWQQRDSFGSPGMQQVIHDWVVARYGFASREAMRAFFGGRRRILDAGCGAGMATRAWMDAQWRGSGTAEWVGIDISAAIDVVQERLGAIPGTHFVQADILQLPFRAESFDTIFSEGVLHHTPSTERALKALLPLLTPGGELMVYLYRRKGPVREFTDDYIRAIVSEQDPAAAWALLRPLTRLGQALAELKTAVDVPEDIPYLGIKAGRYDVQRLIYWHFAKLFWNEALTFEENNHVNFDWYHPRYAHRQTEEDIRRWCAEGGLRITHLDAQESGFTVRASKG